MKTIADYKKWLEQNISELERIKAEGALDHTLILIVSEERRLATFKECLKEVALVEDRHTNFTF